MQMPNPTMPQAQFFFTYVMWKDEATDPLQCHVAFGFDEASLNETRRLVQSGAQVTQLLYLGPVCSLEPHHRRLVRKLTRPGPDQPENDETLGDPLEGIAAALVSGE